MDKAEGKEALEHFHNTRKVLLMLMNYLQDRNLLKYHRIDDLNTVLLDQRIARSIMINGLPTGVTITLPEQLKPITDCEFNYVMIARDAIIFGMLSLYHLTGDERRFNIAIPTTHSMADFLRNAEKVDIGTYSRVENEYTINLSQYFKTDFIDASFFETPAIQDNWVQLASIGGVCMTLEEQGLYIPSDYKEMEDILKGSYINDVEEFDSLCKVILSVRN